MINMVDEWCKLIAENISEEEIKNHLIKHATTHLKEEEQLLNWIDSLINLTKIYNYHKKRTQKSLINRYKLLQKYKKKHRSKF